MIHSFYVENFLSIKENQSVSFATSSDRTMRDLVAVEVKPNLFINKLGIFYGANASGKSNMLYALETLFLLLISPQYDKSKKVVRYDPFALKKGEPTKLGIVFYIDGIKYEYEIEYNDSYIIHERLEYAPSGVAAIFYSRDFSGLDRQPKIKIGNTLNLSAKTKNSIIEGTFNNHTVLSTIAKVSLKDDAKPFMDLYNWVRTKVHDVDGDFQHLDMINEINEVCQDSQKKSFYLSLLNKADFNITNFSIVDASSSLPPKLVEQIKSSNMNDEEKFRMLNDISFTNHSTEGDFEVLSKFQSDGTRRFAELLSYLYDMIKENHIYFFDELGNRLHYDLMVYYITFMLYNSKKSQLLFTTHNIMLLEEDFIRRDMIYLVEKDKENASSSCTRVSDMGLHKNISLFNAYKIGRLGATPNLGSPYLVETKDC